MNVKVARTCTVIHCNADDSVQVGQSLSLSELRSVPAYVLLGDPGAGKTTEFRRECKASEASSAAARYETASDFITFDVDSRPEWRNRVLFIDGLDEVRARPADTRSPLDRIRSRLDRLRRPGFRISCREADWLGLSDQRSLSIVSPDSRLTVVRLDPLDETSIRKILRSLIQDDPEDMINKAKRMGVWPLLENPLTLELLAGAVESGGWPESRLQLFEQACEHWLVSEHNPEHEVAASREPVGNIMDAAGYLCALQLLAGIEGFVSSPVSDSPSFEPLNRLDNGPGLPLGIMKQAVATRLFTEGATGFQPRHRHIAEFLAGRYLAKLVDLGLPARRVTALMTSPTDGRVVTELRGLSAWVAAYPGEARSLLIDADPVGVGLYGDIGGFHMDDKLRLLSSLATFATEGTLLGHRWRDGRESAFRDNTAWSFRSLASAEMVDAIRDVVRSDTDNGYADRAVELVVQVISEAPASELPFLASLSPDLDAMVRDASNSSRARLAALDAFLHVAPSDDSKTQGLRHLLESFRLGILPDLDCQLRGTILEYLYPGEITPAEVWLYAASLDRLNLIGRFWRFWKRSVVDKLSDQQVAELLDLMGDEFPPLFEARQRAHFEDIPIRLLSRGLVAMGDDLEISRLDNWLSAVQPSTTGRIRQGSSIRSGGHIVRAWLEARPQVQKQLYLERLRQTPDGPNWRYQNRSGDVRLASQLPPDFGLWCLEQALGVYSAEPTVTKRLLESAYLSLNDPMTSKNLTEALIEASVEERPALKDHFRELREVRRSSRRSEQEHEHELNILKQQQDEEATELRDDWHVHLRSHESDLRSNTFSPSNLHTLALVYSGEIQTHVTSSPRERVAEFIGGDLSLVDAVIASLRGAVLRDDLPPVDETISLYSQSREPWLAFPVLVSMDILANEPEVVLGISDRNRRRALALYYCFPFHHQVGDGEGVRSCHDAWLDQDPGLVLDVLHRCAVTALRDGAEHLPGVTELDRIERHQNLAERARLKLLRAFPTRIPSQQLRQFDQLLSTTLAQDDKTALEDLARRKLAMQSMSVAHRIRWLTVDALRRGGQRTQRLRVYAGTTERRTRHLAEFLHNTRDDPGRTSVHLDEARPELVGSLIELLGRAYGPQRPEGFVTVDVSTSDLVSGLISQLASLADAEALKTLAGLVNDPRLARWHRQLVWARERQRHLLRDLSYTHPDIKQVQRTLEGQAPTNVADLAALLSDALESIADHVRGAAGNPWRQFWNEDPHGRPKNAKPEESCRDVLVELLRARLPRAIDVAPEGRYAADTRADIRVFHNGYNVPIEIKKNGHRHLWSALQRQLIGQYTTDPATSGYGIYLVLWFGPDETKPPPDDPRPTTPEELRRLLKKDLTDEQARKTSVIVIDTTRH